MIDQLEKLARENRILTENITHVQQRCTTLLEEKRAVEAERDSFKRAADDINERNGKLARQLAECVKAHQSTLFRPSLTSHVRRFMAEGGQALPEVPCVPDDATVRLRLKLVLEEFEELLDACDAMATTSTFDTGGRIHLGKRGVDIVEAVDAIADLMFVLEGFALALGVSMQAVHDEVARSNISKFPTTMNADGKILKGPHYSPPDLRRVLIAQGWDGK